MTDSSSPARRPRRAPPPPRLGHTFAARARARRDAMLLERFPDFAKMRVLDLGGTPAWWQETQLRPAAVTILNLKRGPNLGAWVTVVRGDALDPPPRITRERYDLVFSNSLIEHVGGDLERWQFADVATSFAPHHWVQTPNRGFPIEPHWLFPGFQFLPIPVRVRIAQRWPLGHVRPKGADRAAAYKAVRAVELLSAADLGRYFPESTVLRERYAGLTKSLIATK